MLAILAVPLLSAASAFAQARPPNLFTSVLLHDPDPAGARCLDGTPPRIWVHKSQSPDPEARNKWAWHFQGGGGSVQHDLFRCPLCSMTPANSCPSLTVHVLCLAAAIFFFRLVRKPRSLHRARLRADAVHAGQLARGVLQRQWLQRDALQGRHGCLRSAGGERGQMGRRPAEQLGGLRNTLQI